MTTIFWGPLYFIFDVAWENQLTGIVIAAICIAFMSSILVFPKRPITLVFFVLGCVLWLFSGMIGRGIDV